MGMMGNLYLQEMKKGGSLTTTLGSAELFSSFLEATVNKQPELRIELPIAVGRERRDDRRR